ncbi:hypothetical protein scyTo_0018515 [Scyliorhinus torazame]|uniref:Uncharacterized protein n=1 Tax=Scyliorhinus torazame TaxID=75743 RepID=A0A401PXC2_SCYTO|nr:hypothetical protein [Scyliorhinus torazame]
MKILVTLLLCAGVVTVTVAIPVTQTSPMEQEPVPSAVTSQGEDRVANKTLRVFNALKKILPEITFEDNCMRFRFGLLCRLEPGSLKRLNATMKVDRVETEPME